jgi:hypothetical protein
MAAPDPEIMDTSGSETLMVLWVQSFYTLNRGFGKQLKMTLNIFKSMISY